MQFVRLSKRYFFSFLLRKVFFLACDASARKDDGTIDKSEGEELCWIFVLRFNTLLHFDSLQQGIICCTGFACFKSGCQRVLHLRNWFLWNLFRVQFFIPQVTLDKIKFIYGIKVWDACSESNFFPSLSNYFLPLLLLLPLLWDIRVQLHKRKLSTNKMAFYT